MIYIVTLEKNNGAGLEKTASSLASLKINWKWLIVSQSKDFSPLVNSLNPRIVSDSGTSIYDAMNIGLEGVPNADDLLYFLNSGDEIITPNFEKAILLLDSKTDYLICKVSVREKNGDFVRYSKNESTEITNMLRGGQGFLQQGVIHRKAFFDKFGKFNADLKIAADLDLYARSVSLAQVGSTELLIANFYLGGISSTHRFTTLMELRMIRKSLEKNITRKSEFLLVPYYSLKMIGRATLLKILPDSFKTMIRSIIRSVSGD